jgi:hypothetical protein
MIRVGIVCVVLFSLPVSAGPRERVLGEWADLKQEVMGRRAVRRVVASATKQLAVDCQAGESIQKTIDKNVGALSVQVSGLCLENVRIDDREITLTGTSPATDGIRSLSLNPALSVLNGSVVHVSGLSFSDNPGNAINVSGASYASIDDCVLNGNGGGAPPNSGSATIFASASSTVEATGVTFSGNARRAVNARQGGAVVCRGCEISANGGYAAVATNGGFITLLQSTVSQRFGLQAVGAGSYVDIDCVSDPYPHACSMLATGRAASASSLGSAGMWASGDFTGQVTANERGSVFLYGARQLAAGQPGEGPSRNMVAFFADLIAYTSNETATPEVSRLLGTDVFDFGRLLVKDGTEVNGVTACSSAGDAWLDPGVVAEPGASVTGCDHASLP